MNGFLDRYDMHAHTLASDGMLSTLQLAEHARRMRLAGVAVTDHDALPDPDSLTHARRHLGVTLIAGVELTVHHGGQRFHLLGYHFDPTDRPLRHVCQRLQQERRARFAHLRQRIAARGVRLDASRLTRLENTPSLGRLHLARELVQARAATSASGAFREYLRDTPDAPAVGIPLADATRLLHAAGGVAVLAHPPARLTGEFWHSLADAGLDGVEAVFPKAARTHQRFLKATAARFGWITTAGSDYHGDPPRDFLGQHSLSFDEFEATRRGRAAPASALGSVPPFLTPEMVTCP